MAMMLNEIKDHALIYLVVNNKELKAISNVINLEK